MLSRLALIQNHTLYKCLFPGVHHLSTLSSSTPESSSSSLKARHVAEPNTLDYKVYLESEGKVSSFWHDIPLINTHFSTPENGNVFNMVVEIPRFSNAKLEISKELKFNPIVQDTKKGKLRFVKNLFPYHGYLHNYGALPQTWENPYKLNSYTNLKGDNDPLDVCEIGSIVGTVGEIKAVKLLGTIALIDEGETDWKLIAIDINDPIASNVNNLDDVESHFPGLLDATRIWFRDYKKPDGKPANEFAFDAKYLGKDDAHKIVEECYESWKTLFGEDMQEGIELSNSTLDKTNEHIKDNFEVGKFVYSPSSGAKIDRSVDKWHFV